MADAFGSTGMSNPGGEASKVYYSDPNYVQQLLKGLTGQQQQLGNFVQNPTASPLFQGQLSGLLKSLIPSEQQAVTGLNDMFRGAGNTGSSVYGGAAQGLQSDILQNRQTMASKLLGQSFPQIVQALLGQMGLTPQMLNALKLQQGATPNAGGGAGGGTGSTSLGLNTPMAGDQMSSTQFGGGSYAPNSGYAAPQGWGGVNPLPPAGYGPNGSLTQAEYNSYYGKPSPSSTIFMPGGQYVSGGNAAGTGALWNPPGTQANPFAGLEATNYGETNPT